MNVRAKLAAVSLCAAISAPLTACGPSGHVSAHHGLTRDDRLYLVAVHHDVPDIAATDKRWLGWGRAICRLASQGTRRQAILASMAKTSDPLTTAYIEAATLTDDAEQYLCPSAATP